MRQRYSLLYNKIRGGRLFSLMKRKYVKKAPKNKMCSTCKKILPRKEFYPHRRMSQGLQSNCRACSRSWHRNRPEYIRAKNALYKKRYPDYHRNWQRKYRMGITPEQVTEMIFSQENMCLGCQRVFDGSLREHVDHCHKTGKIRGLLCRVCNVTIGLLGDNPNTLRRLADYIDGSITKEEAKDYNL